jgi:hypothetical protein
LKGHDSGVSDHPKFLRELPNTKPNRYNSKEISYLLQQNADKRDVSQLSTAAQIRVKIPVRRCENEAEVQKLVKEWFPVLDEIFFFDKAHSVLKGGITLYSDNKENIHGHFSKDKSDIEINLAHHLGRSGYLQVQGGEQRIVCTLLHEMLHAFLHSYACRKKCCEKRVYFPESGHGVTGHGKLWCDAMVKMYASLERLVEWPVGCDIGSSVMNEMQNGGTNWQPTEEQLARWGLSGQTIPNLEGEEMSFLRHEWLGAGLLPVRPDFGLPVSDHEDNIDNRHRGDGTHHGDDRHRHHRPLRHRQHKHHRHHDKEPEYIWVLCVVM